MKTSRKNTTVALRRVLTTTSLTLGICLSGHSHAQADDWQVPRTAEGQPDLQGVWANNSSTPLERPEFFGNRATLS